MLKKWIVLLVTALLTLTACRSPVYNQTEGNVADVKIRAAEARKKSDDSAKPCPPLLVKSGLYVDTSPVSLEREPSWLRNHIVIRGDQLPFSYYSRTVANGSAAMVLTKYQTGLDQSTQVSMSYSGTIKGALDLLASKTGYVYSIHGNSIYWQAFITKTFDIAFMPGGTDYLMEKQAAAVVAAAAVAVVAAVVGAAAAARHKILPPQTLLTASTVISAVSYLSGTISKQPLNKCFQLRGM